MAARSTAAASRPAPSDCSGSTWVSTSTTSGISWRIAASRPSATSWAAPNGRPPSTSRSSEMVSPVGIALIVTRCTARPRLRAITMTRSITVSSSRARGITLTPISALGSAERTAAPMLLLEHLDAVERQRAARGDVDLAEHDAADLPRPHPFDRGDAADLAGDRADALGDARRRSVGQRVDGAAAELPAGVADEQCYHHRRGRIRPRIAEPDTDEAEEDRRRRPHVRAEMQRIGFERRARGVDRDPREHPGAEEVDCDRGDDDAEGDRRRLDLMRMVADEPLPRFPHHHPGQCEQQRGLGKGSDVLDLTVAVLVVLVRRLVGPAHGEIGHHRRGEVDQRMGRLGQDRQRAGQNPDHRLAERQGAGGGNRAECDTFLQVRHAVKFVMRPGPHAALSGREFDSHCDYSRTAGRADDGHPAAEEENGEGRDQAGRVDGL